jgi:hypothetical protein
VAKFDSGIGTQVQLTGQKLLNGIATANAYMPNVNAPSRVISLSPLTMIAITARRFELHILGENEPVRQA